MTENLIKPWCAEYEDYLRDESRRVGVADSISFPKSEPEVVEIVRQIGAQGGTVTTQGARTGLTAGAVPQGGHVLNLSRMTSVGEVGACGDSGEYSLTVQPGVTLAEIRKVTEGNGLLFPPDPTETSASIGGMVACNASGAMSFFYGSTRRWIRAVRMVLSDGSAMAVRRGESIAAGRNFSLRTEDGRSISGRLPSYTQPSVKSAAGYYVADDMDLLDLLIGMEGTLGIITEIELRLIPRPKALVGLTAFLPSVDAALKTVRLLRGEEVDGLPSLDARPVAIELFNHDALDLLRRMRSDNPAFAEIPVLRPHYHTAVYTEFHGSSEEDLESAVMGAMEAMMEFGASDEDTWYATGEREMAPLKAFRHAIPEAVNLLIGERKKQYPSLTKLGTDMSVPGPRMEAVMAMYSNDLTAAGLESVIFGHIGNNHVHVNILPNDSGEYDRGRELYLSWAERIVAMGGSVSAEHGIGKIKAPFLKLMYGEDAIAEMRVLKTLFDPKMMLNPGSWF